MQDGSRGETRQEAAGVNRTRVGTGVKGKRGRFWIDLEYGAHRIYRHVGCPVNKGEGVNYISEVWGLRTQKGESVIN